VNRLSASTASTSGSATPTGGAARRLVDSVDLSDHARFLAALRRIPSVRQDVVERVRGELARGGYDTADKLDAALDRLIDSL
jgi:hypothetical protein